MSDLPLEIKKHHYKKWKGKIFINPENGDILELVKIINRTRGWRKGFNFGFKILIKNNKGYHNYYSLCEKYDRNTLCKLKLVSLDEINEMKDDLKTLFS